MGNWYDEFVDTVEDAFDAGERLVGQTVAAVSHAAGDVLHDVGLDSWADAVRGAGDHVASELGATPGELELESGTHDPTQLVHGDPGALRQAGGKVTAFHQAFEEGGDGLRGISVGEFTGESADAFHRSLNAEVPKWFAASDAMAKAAKAFGDMADAVEYGQKKATEAIGLRDEAIRRHDEWDEKRRAYNDAAAKYNAGETTVKPTEPGPDPGVDLMHRAHDALKAGRDHRNSVGDAVAGVWRGAAGEAPPLPPASERVMADVFDLAQAAQTANAHFSVGLVSGLTGLVKMVRTVNASDPYNAAHPAEYLRNVTGVAAGLTNVAAHPDELVKGFVGDGWSTDPAQALGVLTSQLVPLGPPGAGVAAGAARTAARTALEDGLQSGMRSAARDGLESGVRDAGSAVSHAPAARPTELPHGNQGLPTTHVADTHAVPTATPAEPRIAEHPPAEGRPAPDAAPPPERGSPAHEAPPRDPDSGFGGHHDPPAETPGPRDAEPVPAREPPPAQQHDGPPDAPSSPPRHGDAPFERTPPPDRPGPGPSETTTPSHGDHPVDRSPAESPQDARPPADHAPAERPRGNEPGERGDANGTGEPGRTAPSDAPTAHDGRSPGDGVPAGHDPRTPDPAAGPAPTESSAARPGADTAVPPRPEAPVRPVDAAPPPRPVDGAPPVQSPAAPSAQSAPTAPASTPHAENPARSTGSAPAHTTPSRADVAPPPRAAEHPGTPPAESKAASSKHAPGDGSAVAGVATEPVRPHAAEAKPGPAEAHPGSGETRPSEKAEEKPKDVVLDDIPPPLVRDVPYETGGLKPQYVGEQHPGGPMGSPGVRYLDSWQRETLRVTVHDGRLFDSDGLPFDTTHGVSAFKDTGGRAIFVMDEHGNLYASLVQKYRVFHHSSFLAGHDVAAAGELVVKDGRIELLTDRSGHYMPGRAQTQQALDQLASQGIVLDPRNVHLMAPPGS